jgi:hypothetical protein
LAAPLLLNGKAFDGQTWNMLKRRTMGLFALALALATVLGVGLWAILSRVQIQEVRSLCESLPKGISVSQARSLVEAQGYLFLSPTNTGPAPGLIVSRGCVGCEFQVEHDRIVSAKYVHYCK